MSGDVLVVPPPSGRVLHQLAKAAVLRNRVMAHSSAGAGVRPCQHALCLALGLRSWLLGWISWPS